MKKVPLIDVWATDVNVATKESIVLTFVLVISQVNVKSSTILLTCAATALHSTSVIETKPITLLIRLISYITKLLETPTKAFANHQQNFVK